MSRCTRCGASGLLCPEGDEFICAKCIVLDARPAQGRIRPLGTFKTTKITRDEYGSSNVKTRVRSARTPSENYALYLKGDHWIAERAEALEAQGRKCQSCGEGFFLHVHHRTYANIGHELPEDLVVLCGHCHEELHALAKENDYSVEEASDAYLGSTATS